MGQEENCPNLSGTDITEALLYKWSDAFFERAPAIFTDQRSNGNGSDPQAEQVAELERMVAKLMMEIEMLKKAHSLLTSTPASRVRWKSTERKSRH